MRVVVPDIAPRVVRAALTRSQPPPSSSSSSTALLIFVDGLCFLSISCFVVYLQRQMAGPSIPSKRVPVSPSPSRFQLHSVLHRATNHRANGRESHIKRLSLMETTLILTLVERRRSGESLMATAYTRSSQTISRPTPCTSQSLSSRCSAHAGTLYQ